MKAGDTIGTGNHSFKAVDGGVKAWETVIYSAIAEGIVFGTHGRSRDNSISILPKDSGKGLEVRRLG